MSRSSPQISFRWGLVAVFSSAILISGSITFCWLLWKQSRAGRREDPHYVIRSIVHVTQGEPLPRGFLEEWLDISRDHPPHCYAWNWHEAQRRLQECPLFREVAVRPLPPNVLSIEYTLREPFAFLYEQPNRVVDRKGNCFPFFPFFSPKNLPQFIFGTENPSSERLYFTLDMVQAVSRPLYEKGWQIVSLDVSRLSEASLGRKEGVLQLYHAVREQTCYLRFTEANFRQEVANYLALLHHPHYENADSFPTLCVDARLPHLAYIKTVT